MKRSESAHIHDPFGDPVSLENINIYEAQGKSLEILMAWQAMRDAAYSAREQFAASVAPDAKEYGTVHSLCGVSTCAALDPQEWRPTKDYIKNATNPCYEPNKKTKAGKALAKVMSDRKFSIPDGHWLSAQFKFGALMTAAERGCGMYVHNLHAQKVGDKLILFVPSAKKLGVGKDEFIPEGRLMKLSEYYALIEAENEAAKASA
jgi:hypothetical protein